MITEEQARTYAAEIRSEMLSEMNPTLRLTPIPTMPSALIWRDENGERVVVHDPNTHNLKSIMRADGIIEGMARVMHEEGSLTSPRLSAWMHFAPLETSLSVGGSFGKSGDSTETLMYADYTDGTFSWYIVNGKTQLGEFLGKMHNVPWDEALTYMPESSMGHEFLSAAMLYTQE